MLMFASALVAMLLHISWDAGTDHLLNDCQINDLIQSIEVILHDIAIGMVWL